MLKYGMPYFLLFLVGFMELSAIWERLVTKMFSFLEGTSQKKNISCPVSTIYDFGETK